MWCARICFVASLVVLSACRVAPPPPPPKDLPPCGDAAKPECFGKCPDPGQTCFLRPGFPTCACYY